MTWIAVFIGGGLGSISRYGLSILTNRIYSGPFPLGTFLANLMACIVLGLAIAYFSSRSQFNEAYKALVLVGFCGGFSTFSTFSHETLSLVKEGQWGWVTANVFISFVACVGVLYLFSKYQSS
ncbi:MAG: fluoride efflux transporter CrcB [Flavobacteriales bacterium]|nr:fluoride efflux transporter CrcB [Flavobacteriales bacterium]